MTIMHYLQPHRLAGHPSLATNSITMRASFAILQAFCVWHRSQFTLLKPPGCAICTLFCSDRVNGNTVAFIKL